MMALHVVKMLNLRDSHYKRVFIRPSFSSLVRMTAEYPTNDMYILNNNDFIVYCLMARSPKSSDKCI